MTNEKLLEELLWEAYDLGIHNEVLELSKVYEKKQEKVDAINRALYELKSKLQSYKKVE